jgi:hypothetical protein
MDQIIRRVDLENLCLFPSNQKHTNVETMRKLLLLIAIILFQQHLFAQGVGINTTTPHPSAALHIQSSDKGVLIPKVNLTSLIDAVTVPSPANALMVYNTNAALKDGTGFYYNAGTPASPNWKSISDFSMPYYYGGNESSALFKIENYNDYTAAIAIKGDYAGNAIDGTGVFAKSNTGFALQVDGKIRIFGSNQTPGAGKVLTSDNFGHATWQDVLPPIAFRASGVKGGGSEQIAKNVESKIPFATEEYDLGNNYNDVNTSPHSSFIAPVAGIYHFDVVSSWQYPFGETANNYVSLKLNRIRGGTTVSLVEVTNYNNSDDYNDISTDVQLEQGDQVYVAIVHTPFDYLSLFIQNRVSNFSGRLVIKQ